jgi:hypothetical protein
MGSPSRWGQRGVGQRVRRAAVAVPVALGALAAAAPGASAESLLSDRVSAGAAKKRACHASLAAPGARGVVQRTVRLAEPSLLRAGLRAKRGDWDLGIFQKSTRRSLGGAAGPRSRELAEAFVPHGAIVVQACRRKGRARTARLDVRAFAVPVRRAGEEREISQLVAVETPTAADKQRLQGLGLDLTEHGGDGHLEVVLHGAGDVAKLKASGLRFEVEIPDLAARHAANRLADARYARRTNRSSLPSGRDGYRRLVDFEADMKALAEEHPQLVKPIVLPHASLEGRPIHGIEITRNVHLRDGKPVYLQMGLHHAREWPSGETAMEFAIDLVRNYGSDPRITRLVDGVRTVVVPVINPDGYNLSREAPVDFRALGTAAPITRAVMDALAPTGVYGDIDSLGVATTGISGLGGVVKQYGSNAGGVAAILIDSNTSNFAYKRRNCRMAADQRPAEGECARGPNRNRGTDPNRNYGGFWGGAGASASPTSDTFRGTAPFSEPEVQNVRELVSSRQVTTLITNHTYSNLVLRPPGLVAEGPTPDEPIYKDLGDAMGRATGFASQFSFELYDTTGTTEDWSYYQTGGLGFTFEIGPHEFHPPFEQVVAEYEGRAPTAVDGAAGDRKEGGVREAYLLAMESAANTTRHAVLKGNGPKGGTVEITRTGEYLTSPVIGGSGPLTLSDTVTSSMAIPQSGKFEWHVNPSTRPYRQRDRFARAETPVSSQAISGQALPPSQTFPVEVKEGDPRFFVATIAGQTASDDYDLYLYRGSLADPREFHASSATSSNREQISIENLPPGRYTLEVRNFSATGPWSVTIERYAGDASRGVPAGAEAWTLTCRDKHGRSVGTQDVVVDRGQALDVSTACGAKPGKVK